jgi:hypothetical protein
MYQGKSNGCGATLTHNRTISRLSRQKHLQQHRYNVLKMTVNGASAIVALASWIIVGLSGDINTYSNYQPPF